MSRRNMREGFFLTIKKAAGTMTAKERVLNCNISRFIDMIPICVGKVLVDFFRLMP